MRPVPFSEIADAVGFVPDAADLKLWDGIEQRHARIGVVDADPLAFVIAMLWLTLNRPDDVCLLVCRTAKVGQMHIELARDLIENGAKKLPALTKVMVGQSCYGLGRVDRRVFSAVHVRPGEIAVLPERKVNYTILVPDIDAIPGYRLTDIAALSRNEHVTLAVNAAR